jgi:hypothetical protein
MAERILEVHNHGTVNEIVHIGGDDSVVLETFQATDDDGAPVGPERIQIHIRSAHTPVVTEVKPVDEASEVQAPVTTERTMAPREQDLSGLTVAQLRELLAERDLPTSGRKAELIERLAG